MGAQAGRRAQNLVRHRWRSLLGLFSGVVGGCLSAGFGARPGAATLIGWNVAAAVFLAPTLWMLAFDDETRVRARAADADENRVVIMSLILAAVAASLAAIVYALREAHAPHGANPAQHSDWILVLSASTLVLSWTVVHSLFALHYAHKYFGDRDTDGSADEGVNFPGDPPRTYREFIYMAVCIGATCQVSDFEITHASFRNVVTAHALVSFAFNTMVLALGINIIGNLMGQ